MLGLKTHLLSHQISSIPFRNSILKPQTIVPPLAPFQAHDFSYLRLKSRRKKRRRFNASSPEEYKDNYGDGDELPRVNLRWRELLLDPDRNNVVAVGLTGALAWAGVQVLRQLFVVTMATLIAGVKYSFIGVLLIFIVVTLL